MQRPSEVRDEREVRCVRAAEIELTGGLLRRVAGLVRAVDGVSLAVGRDETFGLVGESGSGKSTTARVVLGGDPPSPVDPPAGCRFHPRCPWAMDVCREVDPPAFLTPAATTVHCHLHAGGPRLAGAPVAAMAKVG